MTPDDKEKMFQERKMYHKALYRDDEHLGFIFDGLCMDPTFLIKIIVFYFSGCK